jgi:meiotic recombination protein REC8
MNDPAFEPQFNLPEFRIDDDGNAVLGSLSQKRDTQRTSSQMSPFANGLSSASRVSAAELLWPRSSASASFHHLEMPFGHDSLVSRKPGETGLGFGGQEEEPLNIDDEWDIRIDADGNIIQDEELELPAPPRPHAGDAGPAMPQDEVGPAIEHQDDIVFDMGGDLLPDAEAFPQTPRPANAPRAHESSPVAGAAPVRKRRRPMIRPDQATMITRAEQHAWNNNYVERMTEAHRKQRKPAAKASKHAHQYLFGNGIFGVAVNNGITGPNHPLAQLFSGAALQRAAGFVVDGNEGLEVGQIQSQRRSSGQAFPETKEAEVARRVRPRLDEDDQAGQAGQLSLQEDNMPVFFEPEVEIGRELGTEMANITAPWNRPGSVPASSVKGGSVRATGAGPKRVSASPLHGRGVNFPAIERFSDDLPYGSDGLMPHDASSIAGDIGPAGQQGANATSQMMQDALDDDGRNFLGFVEGIAATKGENRLERRWVAFDDLFEPQDRNAKVATLAFFHILTLATKDVIKVQQQDPLAVEFGMIHIGVTAGEQAAADGDVFMRDVEAEVEQMGAIQGEVHGAALGSEERSSSVTMA